MGPTWEHHKLLPISPFRHDTTPRSQLGILARVMFNAHHINQILRIGRSRHHWKFRSTTFCDFVNLRRLLVHYNLIIATREALSDVPSNWHKSIFLSVDECFEASNSRNCRKQTCYLASMLAWHSLKRLVILSSRPITQVEFEVMTVDVDWSLLETRSSVQRLML